MPAHRLDANCRVVLAGPEDKKFQFSGCPTNITGVVHVSSLSKASDALDFAVDLIVELVQVSRWYPVIPDALPIRPGCTSRISLTVRMGYLRMNSVGTRNWRT